jgi:hypothetical protein
LNAAYARCPVSAFTQANQKAARFTMSMSKPEQDREPDWSPRRVGLSM